MRGEFSVSSIIALVISIINFLYTTLMFLRSAKKPVYKNIVANVYPKNGIFSYNSSQEIPDIYTPNPCIEVFLDCINQSSLPLTLYGFQLFSICGSYRAPFSPLTIETSPFIDSNYIYGVRSKSELSNQIVHHIHLFKDEVIVIPPYSVYRFNEQFVATSAIMNIESNEMMLSFESIQQHLFGGQTSIKNIHITCDSFRTVIKQKVYPVKELSLEHLKQVDVSRH